MTTTLKDLMNRLAQFCTSDEKELLERFMTDRLSPDETRLGQECSTEEFYERYKGEVAAPLRGGYSGTEHGGAAKEGAGRRAGGIPAACADAPYDNVGAEEKDQ